MSRQSELAALGRVADTSALSNRRLTYNGAMNVWQRGTSADTASNGDYMCDRWQVGFTGLDGNVDWDQETSSTPDGFAYALKISTDASETSLDAADYLFLHQKFEGQDLQHLQKGTSGAKKLALSFWVKSSVASTYTVGFRDTDNSRIISKSYTINTADTWEYKTVIFEGDTTGSLTNDNNVSLDLQFWIDTGSNWTSGTFSTDWIAQDNTKRVYDTTGWLESTSPTFYITGVQLEVGDTATEFEHRSFGDELARCQRYYQKSYAYGDAPQTNGSQGCFYVQRFNLSDRYFLLGNQFKGSGLRSTPTLSIYSRDGTANNINQYNSGTTKISIALVNGGDSKKIANFLDNNSGSGNDNPQEFHWEADAEL